MVAGAPGCGTSAGAEPMGGGEGCQTLNRGAASDTLPPARTTRALTVTDRDAKREVTEMTLVQRLFPLPLLLVALGGAGACEGSADPSAEDATTGESEDGGADGATPAASDVSPGDTSSPGDAGTGDGSATDGGAGATGDAAGDASPSTDAMTRAGPIALEPGEVVELPFEEAKSGATLATPLGTEEYLLILASTRLEGPTDQFDFVVRPGEPPAGVPVAVTGCALTGEGFETLPAQDAPPEPGEAPALGQVREFLVPVGYPTPTVPFEAIAVGQHAVVWADVSPDHPAELDAAFAAEFLTDFDELILPRERAVFGPESDLDGDGRIALLFTPLTYQEAVAFFMSCDLHLSPGCPGSNGGEVLYLTPPNTIAPPYNTANAIKEILAHELQHLIHFNRNVLLNGRTHGADSAYILEGFGALAQDVSGYQSGNLYVTKAGLADIGDFSFADLATDGQPYDMGRDGALRGGAYLFVRWLYDRAGGDQAQPDGAIDNLGGPALAQSLLGTDGSAVTGLADLTGLALADVAMDFFTALGLSNRDEVGGTAPVNPCFAYLPTVVDPITGKQRGADLFANFHGQSMTGPTIGAATDGGGSLRSGGVQLVRVVAGPAAETSFVVEVAPEAAPRLRLARIK